MSRHELTRADRDLPAVIQLKDGTCKYVKVQAEGRHHQSTNPCRRRVVGTFVFWIRSR